jgi:hypothetical protein
MLRFQCPECGFGDYEVGHLVAEASIYCVVCLEEQGRQIRVWRWEQGEGTQARLRSGLADGAGVRSARSVLPPLIGSLSPV